MSNSRKNISVIAVALLLLAGAFWGYWQVKERTLSGNTSLYTAVSSRAALVLETKNLKSFAETLMNEADFWTLLNNVGDFDDFNDFITKISDAKNAEPTLSQRNFLVVYNQTDNQLLSGVILGQITPKEAKESAKHISQMFAATSETMYRTEQITVFGGKDGKAQFYTLFKDGIFIGTAHLEEMKKTIDLLEDKSANLHNNLAFNAVRATAGKNVPATIFINAKWLFPAFADNMKDDFPALKAKMAAFPEWLGLDISLANGQLLANGYSNNADGFVNTAENQFAGESNVCPDLPDNTAFFYYQHIGDFATFKERKVSSPTFRSEPFLKDFFDGEIVSGYAAVDKKPLNQSNFVMFSTKDSTLTAEQLENAGKKSQCFSTHIYRSINIYELPRRYGLTAAFDNSAAVLRGTEFAAVAGRYVLVADNADFLAELAGRVMSGQTLATDAVFRAASENCSSSLTALAYINFPALLKYANEIFDAPFAGKITDIRHKLSGVQSLGWQMQNERGMIYHNAFLCYKKTAAPPVVKPAVPVAELAEAAGATRLLWKTDFSEGASTAIVVHNKATAADEILIQDAKNRLHFYDHNGNLQWSLALESPVLGNKIYQIDYHKNNKYQFAFNTAGQLYLIDRKGNAVDKYPLDLPSEASAPLAVFDYENTKEYRIFIPAQDRNIYLFKKDGTRPPDWQCEQTAGVAQMPVQHILADNKDYLCVNDGTRAYILNRRGEERIKLKSAFDIAPDSEFYLRKTAEGSFFFVFDKQGYVKRIDMDGNVKSYPPSSSEVAALNLKKADEKAQNLNSNLYVGPLKPLTNHCVLTLNDGELFCYELK